MSSILIVDDEPMVLQGLKRMLHAQGCKHDCVGVSSADDALRQLSEGTFDVVVSDVRMPGRDGVELLARIKGDPGLRHIPVIMLTGHADADAKRIALHLGAYDFINKPADPAELIARLENAIRMHSYEDSLRKQNDIMERQLIQAQKMEVVGLLASGLVHDLNNILGAIIGYTDLAGQIATEDVHLKNYLKNASKSAEHATVLVKQILDLGRVSERNGGPVDLVAEVSNAICLLRNSAPANVNVEWVAPEGALVVQIDATQCHQVLLNLCTNAIQAMGNSGQIFVDLAEIEIDVEMSACLGLAATGRFARLNVRDTGPGMEESVRLQIFDPFFTTKPRGKGTGIGLSVVQRIVEHGHGIVRALSEPGEGTTFEIYWPLVDNAPVSNTDGNGGAEHDIEEANSICR